MTRGGRGLGYYLIEAIYLCSYVLPHRVGFLCRFGLKTGIWSEIEGTKGPYERIYRFNSKRVRKKEKYANSKWI